MNQITISSQTDSTPTNSKQLNALREVCKIDRKAFTDAVKDFVDYVDQVGEESTFKDSKSSIPYTNFTRSVYKAFGINKKQIEARINDENYGRDCFDTLELLFVQTAERAVTATLVQGMRDKLSREEIKNAYKRAIQMVYASFSYLRDGQQFEGGAQ